MKTIVTAGAAALVLGFSAAPAAAQDRPGGCLQYGLGGAILGHFAGGHRLKGALAGCVVGMARRRHYEREVQERRRNEQIARERNRDPGRTADRRPPGQPRLDREREPLPPSQRADRWPAPFPETQRADRPSGPFPWPFPENPRADRTPAPFPDRLPDTQRADRYPDPFGERPRADRMPPGRQPRSPYEDLGLGPMAPPAGPPPRQEAGRSAPPAEPAPRQDTRRRRSPDDGGFESGGVFSRSPVERRGPLPSEPQETGTVY